ncbi:ABC transporter permease [Ahrensia kielensis]|uniref:ABC transporter permease n=1 Tax=Ahrensia kielensis TaxID=76980 RepID=UPI0003812A70|nr:ABC transporter permease [Ahrensia kielensis]
MIEQAMIKVPVALRKRLDAAPDAPLLIATFGLLLLMILVFSFTAENFFSLSVLRNILTQTSIYIILGVGLTIVLTVGEIDISMGSIIGLAATVLGMTVITWGYPIGVGLLATFIVGVFCGFMNGFLTAVVRVPSIIVTLGTLTFFRGLAYLLGGSTVMVEFPPFLVWIGSGSLVGIPVPIWIAFIAVLWGYLFLKHTRIGQHLTAVGGNGEAARLAGINTRICKIIAFLIMGVMSALATIIIVARMDASQSVMGKGIELQVLAAVVLGGTSLFGGRGVILGSLLGALILSILQTGLLLSGVVHFWQLIAVGGLLIAVVAVRISREPAEGKT